MKNNFVYVKYGRCEMWININHIAKIAIIGDGFVYVDCMDGTKLSFDQSQAEKLLKAITTSSDSVELPNI